MKNVIAQEVVASTKKKDSAPEDTKPASHRTVGQKVGQNWDSALIEDRDEEEVMEKHEEYELKERWGEYEKR